MTYPDRNHRQLVFRSTHESNPIHPFDNSTVAEKDYNPFVSSYVDANDKREVVDINQHLKRIFSDNELEEGSVVKHYLIAAADDGKKYQMNFA